MESSKLDKLFIAISGVLGSRVTKDNYRTAFKDIAATRGVTRKDKTLIIVEILAYLIEKE